ncbi:MAG: M28 family peptidase [Acidobacteriota bacterium]|nr:M28 family peptidase [Blastocatellia bacterium]MDW8241190.1 M28 family peptidase [Acidobacteriota bacterium]
MKTRYWLVIALVIVTMGLALRVTSSEYGDKRTFVVSAITPQELYWHIRYLASDDLKGRFTGTPEAREAARYIADEFRSYGVKPLGDAVGSSYFQTFPFIAGVKLGEKNHLSSNMAGRARQWTLKQDFMPMAFSAPMSVEGEVVFAGYGISATDLGYDDYAGIEVAGRIVMVLRHSPEGDHPHSRFERHASLRAKALMARQRGARAIIFIADDEDFKNNKLAQLEFDYSFSDAGIVAVGVSRQLAREWIASSGANLDELQNQINQQQKPSSRVLTGVTASVQVDLVKDTQPADNVIGYIEGNDPNLKHEVVIIGAHYDHLGLGGPSSLAPQQRGEVHNGADDNASGTAGLLELAQLCAARRSELKRSLLFIAFSGEEEGLLGSNYYVKHPVIPLERTIAMLNMDMIGRLKENTLNVQGVGTSPQWPALLEEVNRDLSQPAAGSSPESRITNHDPGTTRFTLKLTSDGAGPSDHAAFYLKDIPVLFFFTGTHSDYHKPSDDFDKINAEGQARVVQFIYDTLMKIQALPTRPSFTKTQSSEMGRRGFRVTFGVMPDYAEEAEGMKISGVREGSAAEKAGLKAGDVLVRIGATKIKNVHDYMFVLGELKAGEAVEVEVIREGRRLVFNVVPEKRN